VIIKRYLFLFVLFLMNSMDFFNNVGLKIGVPYFEMYIGIAVLCIFFALFLNVRSFSLRNVNRSSLILIVIVFSYSLLQFMNGLFHAVDYKASVVVFLSLIFVLILLVILVPKDITELRFYLQGVFYLALLFYPLVDVLSYLVTGKSQHVLMANIMPVLAIQCIILYMTSSLRSERSLLITCFGLYIVWGVVSVLYLTSDQRFQAKAYFFLISIVIFYFFALLLSKLSFVRALVKNKIFVSSLCMFFVASGLVAIKFFYVSVADSSILDRANSYYIRSAVNELVISDWMSSGWFNVFFGNGLGSSFREYYINYDGRELNLKSHSGLVSLLYEYGLFLSVIFMISVFFWFGFMLIKKSNCGNYIRNERLSYFITLTIFLFIVFLVFYNSVYIFAIPTPNYGEQTQIVACILLVVYCRSLMDIREGVVLK